MTDLVERKEVNVPTSPILQALRVHFDPFVARQVRRFGFEYEMLPSGEDDYYDDDDDDGHDGHDGLTGREGDRLDGHMDDYDPWDCDHDQCNCDECLDSRRDHEYRQFRQVIINERANRPPSQNGSTPNALMARAYAALLIADPTMHMYHCHCSTCNHQRDTPLMVAQGDCSCGVEFVSRIIDLDDFDIARREIGEWVQMMHQWKQDGNWMPDGYESNGNHVHVSSAGDHTPWGADIKHQAYNHVDAMYAMFDWDRVADGGCGTIRSYNRKPSMLGLGGSWLADRGYGTFEHRLWNTPRDPDRLWAHLGISIGLTRWAFHIATMTPDFSFWPDQRDRWGGGQGIADDVYEQVVDNTDLVVGGIRTYIPSGDEFTIARDVISNLRPM